MAEDLVPATPQTADCKSTEEMDDVCRNIRGFHSPSSRCTHRAVVRDTSEVYRRNSADEKIVEENIIKD